MNTNKVVLRAAMATVLGLTTPHTMAGYIEIGNPYKLATEIAVTSASEVTFPNGHGFQIDLSAAAGRTISDTSPMEIRLSLTNGAKFSGGVDMKNFGCDYTGAAAAEAAVSMLNGAAGEASITFKMKDGNISSSGTPKCTVSGLNIKLYAGQQAYTMLSTAYLKSPAEPVIIQTSGTVIDFTQAFGASVDGKTVTIDVTNPALSQKFVGGATLAELGTVSYTAIASSVVKFAVGSSVGKGDILSSLKVTLSGTPLSLASGLVVAVTAGDALGCSATDAGSFLNKTASSTSGVIFSFTQASAAAGIRFCLKTDGSSRIEKGKVTIELDATGLSSPASTPNVTITNPVLATVVKNGASIKVLNIPNPTAADKTFVRIYNLSNSKTSVYGTLYETAAAGTTTAKELGKGKLLGEIDPGAVKILDATAIAAIFGLSTWTGRAWMQVEGDSQQIRVQSLVRSNGTLINMSDRVLEDGGKIRRSDTAD